MKGKPVKNLTVLQRDWPIGRQMEKPLTLNSADYDEKLPAIRCAAMAAYVRRFELF